MFIESSALKKSSRGFTLIELLVVISIIGLLASVGLVALNSALMKARDARRIADINQITKALELYYSNNNHYPTSPADSRNPPNTGVPPYAPLTQLLVPEYLSRAPLPPRNNLGDGSMCSNCDEYFYAPKNGGAGNGFSMCTYVAISSNGNGSTVFGATYCAINNCGPGADLAWCP